MTNHLDVTPVLTFPMLAANLVAATAFVAKSPSRRRPNWLTVGGLLLGLSCNVLLGSVSDGASGALSAGITAAAGAALGFALLALDGGLAGAVLSLSASVGQGRQKLLAHPTVSIGRIPQFSGRKMPYAVAIAAGVCVMILLPPALRS